MKAACSRCNGTGINSDYAFGFCMNFDCENCNRKGYFIMQPYNPITFRGFIHGPSLWHRLYEAICCSWD